MTQNSNAGIASDAVRDEHLELARKCGWLFGMVSAVTLATLIAVAAFGDLSNTFMWVRAAILLAVTPMLLWLIRRGSRGEIRALDRLRLVTTILPIAIVGVDMVPGVCPVWYAGLQSVAALALVPVAVVSWQVSRRPRSIVKEASPKG